MLTGHSDYAKPHGAHEGVALPQTLETGVNPSFETVFLRSSFWIGSVNTSAFIGTYFNASTATLYWLLARLREGHKSLQTLWIFGLEVAGVKM